MTTKPSLKGRVDEIREWADGFAQFQTFQEPKDAAIAELVAIIDKLMEENERLKKFAAKGFACAFDGMDWDGADLQDTGVELGLLELRPVNPDDNAWGADEMYFPKWSKGDD